MSTRLFTVYQDDLAEMATQLMIWKNIHHVPVVDELGNITGLLTWSHMQRFVKEEHQPDLIVSDIMEKNVISADQEMEIQAAITLMKEKEIGCLPIVHADHLIGIVTITDLTQFDHDQSAQQSA